MKLTSKFRIVCANLGPLGGDYYNYIQNVYFSLGLEKLYDTRKAAKDAIIKSGFPSSYNIIEEYVLK